MIDKKIVAILLAVMLSVGIAIYLTQEVSGEESGLSFDIIVTYKDGTNETFRPPRLGYTQSVWIQGRQIYAITAKVNMYITYQGTPSSWTVSGTLNTKFDGTTKTQKTIPKPSLITSGSTITLLTTSVSSSTLQSWDAGQYKDHTLQFVVPSFTITITFADGKVDQKSASGTSSIIGFGVQSDSGITKLSITVGSETME